VLRARIVRISAGFSQVPAGANVSIMIADWHQMVTILKAIQT
jgi:hypothetical protein